MPGQVWSKQYDYTLWKLHGSSGNSTTDLQCVCVCVCAQQNSQSLPPNDSRHYLDAEFQTLKFKNLWWFNVSKAANQLIAAQPGHPTAQTPIKGAEWVFLSTVLHAAAPSLHLQLWKENISALPSASMCWHQRDVTDRKLPAGKKWNKNTQQQNSADTQQQNSIRCVCVCVSPDVCRDYYLAKKKKPLEASGLLQAQLNTLLPWNTLTVHWVVPVHWVVRAHTPQSAESCCHSRHTVRECSKQHGSSREIAVTLTPFTPTATAHTA